METIAETMGLTFFVPSSCDLDIIPPLNILSEEVIGTTGWPDFYIAGSTDHEHRTYDLSFAFQIDKFESLSTVFHPWFQLMELQSQNSDSSKEDIKRLDYTCSIYRVLLDPTGSTVIRWAKAAGCFPVSFPVGDVFDHERTKGLEYSNIPFKACQIRYLDPADLTVIAELMSSSS